MRTNWIDNVVMFLNPRKGAERLRYRMAGHFIKDNMRKFDAGSNGRRTKGWKTGSEGPNVELAASIHEMRNRSRDLYNNNPDAFKAINTIVANVVGTGIRPTVSISSDQNDKKAKKSKAALTKAWKNFADKTTCDFHEKLSFYSLQRQVAITCFMSGSAIVRIRRNTKGFPFSLQVFEPDILDSARDMTIVTSGGYIQRGVEFDKDGKIVAYWMFDRNPHDNVLMNQMISRRIPVKDESGLWQVIHIFDQIRPGQADGYPIGVSTFLKLRDLDVYEDAELVKQQVSACLAGFIYDSSFESATIGMGKDTSGNVLEKLEPGSIEVLPPGKDIKFSNPPNKEGYPEYVKAVKRSIAAGYLVTYEDLTGDLSNANFSSLKSGQNGFKRMVQIWQDNIMINDLCSKVWNVFLIGCDMKGIIKLTDRDDPSNDFPATWTPPAIAMVDPVKETKALIDSIRAGLTSYQDVQRQLGNDPDVTLEEIFSDNQTMDKYNLKLDSDPRADPQRIKKTESPPPAK